jgi:hypothetical protein
MAGLCGLRRGCQKELHRACPENRPEKSLSFGRVSRIKATVITNSVIRARARNQKEPSTQKIHET